MTVEKLYVNDKQHAASEDIPLDTMALKVMNFANDTKFGEEGNLIGDPTETALVQFGMDQGFHVKDQVSAEPRVADLPFDSDRKLMSTIHEQEDGRYLVAVKGAPDVLLGRASKVLLNGQEVPMTEEENKNLVQQYRYGQTSASCLGNGIQVCRCSTRKLGIRNRRK